MGTVVTGKLGYEGNRHDEDASGESEAGKKRMRPIHAGLKAPTAVRWQNVMSPVELGNNDRRPDEGLRQFSNQVSQRPHAGPITSVSCPVFLSIAICVCFLFR
jgi:hypothetical protein